ncbi:MAG: ArdC-like ssDNA-binding domain-containing protein [Acidimicrobiales bacterium]
MPADRTTELLGRLHDGVAAIVTGDDWRRYLDVARRFHNYSWWNTIAILTQRPEATRIAGYRAWRRLGRQVRKGEVGIRILAPCTYRRLVVDDDTDEATQVTQLRGFKVVSVFDIAQTDGDPLPEQPPVEVLDGPAPGLLHHQLASLIRAEGFTFLTGPMPDHHPGALGVTDFSTRTVTVKRGLPAAQRAKTTAHEFAHVLLHEPGPGVPARARQEIEAESVAYVVMGALGVVADAYSFSYVTSWSGSDIEAVQATGERVLDCARRILDRLRATHLATCRIFLDVPARQCEAAACG